MRALFAAAGLLVASGCSLGWDFLFRQKEGVVDTEPLPAGSHVYCTVKENADGGNRPFFINNDRIASGRWRYSVEGMLLCECEGWHRLKVFAYEDRPVGERSRIGDYVFVGTRKLEAFSVEVPPGLKPGQSFWLEGECVEDLQSTK